MTKQIKVTPHTDGSASVEIPASDRCVVCGGDGVTILDPPWEMEYGPDIKSLKAMIWCHIHNDYHCDRCTICKKEEKE